MMFVLLLLPGFTLKPFAYWRSVELLVLVLGLSYGVVAPLILLFCCVYFALG